jgi:hypothetical protein
MTIAIRCIERRKKLGTSRDCSGRLLTNEDVANGRLGGTSHNLPGLRPHLIESWSHAMGYYSAHGGTTSGYSFSWAGSWSRPMLHEMR